MRQRFRFIALCTALFALSASAEEGAQSGMSYARYLLTLFDVNGDGVLTRSEIGPTGVEHFDDIDRDQNGVASAEELAAWYVRNLPDGAR